MNKNYKLLICSKKAKNRFHQKLKTNRPYQKVVTDISEFRYGNKSMRERIYFSPFKDLYSGEIISYTSSQRSQTKYVLDELKQVLASRPKLPTLPHDDSQRPGHPILGQSILPDPKAAPLFSKHVAAGDLPRQCGL